MTRKVLHPLSDEEREALLEVKGLDKNMEPFNVHPLEAEANRLIREGHPTMPEICGKPFQNAEGTVGGICSFPPHGENDHPHGTPFTGQGSGTAFIPKKFVHVADGLGGLMLAGAAYLILSPIAAIPAAVAPVLGGLGALALFLAGKGLPALIPGMPKLTGAAVPTLGSLLVLLEGLGGSVSDPKTKAVVLLVAGVLARLTGRVAPQEVAPK